MTLPKLDTAEDIRIWVCIASFGPFDDETAAYLAECCRLRQAFDAHHADADEGLVGARFFTAKLHEAIRGDK